jgi:DNA-binding transcriptional ArsR family regulator
VNVDQTLAALADATRRDLLARLARGPVPAGRLAQGYAMSRPAVAKHLRVLREAGLVRAEKSGRQQLYCLAPEGLVEIERVLHEIGQFWSTALEAFKTYADSAERS